MKKIITIAMVVTVLFSAFSVVAFADNSTVENQKQELILKLKQEKKALIRYTNLRDQYKKAAAASKTQEERETNLELYELFKLFRQDSIDIIALYTEQLKKLGVKPVEIERLT